MPISTATTTVALFQSSHPTRRLFHRQVKHMQQKQQQQKQAEEESSSASSSSSSSSSSAKEGEGKVTSDHHASEQALADSLEPTVNAMHASSRGGTLLALKTQQYVLLISCNRHSNKQANQNVIEDTEMPRIFPLASTSLFSFTGVYGDGMHLLETLREEYLEHQHTFNTPLPISRAATTILAPLLHARTMNRSQRPFGVHCCLVNARASDNSEGSTITTILDIDPAGTIRSCNATCLGRDADAVLRCIRPRLISGNAEEKESLPWLLQQALEALAESTQENKDKTTVKTTTIINEKSNEKLRRVLTSDLLSLLPSLQIHVVGRDVSLAVDQETMNFIVQNNDFVFLSHLIEGIRAAHTKQQEQH